MPLPCVVAFGPQAIWRSAEQLSQYRDIFVLEPRLRPLVEAVKGLPALWSALEHNDARLQATSGLESARALLQWLDGHDVPAAHPHPPSNTLTGVLTLIVHFTQYLYYIDHDVDYPSHAAVLESVGAAGIQGFCIGQLSAVALACSRNEHDLGIHAATALRLAFCIGAYIDLDRSVNFESRLLAVRWRTETGHERVEDLLKGYNAYISAIGGQTDVTVTVEEADVASLSQKLSEEGMKVVDLGIRGRFHTAANLPALERLLALCEGRDDLCFPDAKHLLVPVRSNSSTESWTHGPLTRHVLSDILCERSEWFQTISAVASALPSVGERPAVGFGISKVIPPQFRKTFNLKVIEASSWSLSHRQAFGNAFAAPATKPSAGTAKARSPYGENAIAVIGMAAKFPGADSIDEFWNVLVEGKSMVSEMPEERFSTKGLRRKTPDGFRFLGNFVRDIQAFDHRFFKKSSREAASMDPQQRLVLQCAYEAMESSGYFGGAEAKLDSDIGCYIGICTNDYNDNVASHNPNAYSSLGTLRAFVAGKISHFFGWSGPSLTVDTACSSSAVAIHDACRALQLDECSQAIAGGVNLFTSPYFYENLIAASFLSPTGQTKPFDAKADGYCRGEGIGLVVLKKLSAAIADGDNVMGVISASGINQNSNTVGITVPHSASQAALYERVTGLAGMSPQSISYVEAHGTGTPVGDPREIASIRDMFKDPQRSDPLYVTSVKGNIGHLEAASGVASLIKTLLMMKAGIVPKQASFDTLNPNIPPLVPDRIAIPIENSKWNASFKAALINNYGASGSNTTLIVCQPPSELMPRNTGLSEADLLPKYPFYISANSRPSLMAYCSAIKKLVDSPPEIDNRHFMANMSYNLATKQNRALPKALAFSASSLADLSSKLQTNSTENLREISIPAKAKPVVLVFGGQVNDAVGLSKHLYDTNSILRQHLDECDTILRSFGLSGLFPEIFQSTQVRDIVSLQAMVFSLQYSCSKAWMESGLKIDAVVGHSLGQFAAMCIAGYLSLEEGLKLVSGRASLMQKHWGDEKGSMIAIEADETLVTKIIATVNENIEVACYNGPNSHVLVGRKDSITRVEKLLVDPAFTSTKIKFKRLNVTHGFHSMFTEDLLPSLTSLAGELMFKEPTIHLETCSKDESWPMATAALIAEHTRTPVYFGQAIGRLASRLGSCTWLEAGSSSSVIGMVRRALDPETTSTHSFESASFTNAKALDSLTDITLSLWKSGHRVQLWSFHQSQKNQYSRIDLPPYQFEKNMHWVEWQEPVGSQNITPEPQLALPAPVERELLTLTKSSDLKNPVAEFLINTEHKSWTEHVVGHAVLGQPLCPANLYVELAVRAASQLSGSNDARQYVPLVEELEITAPLGTAEDRAVVLSLVSVKHSARTWSFHMQSQADANAKRVSHATGKLSLHPANGDSLVADFSRYEKLISHSHLDAIGLDSRSEALQGAMVYKVFSEVVDYADYYQSVRAVYARDGEVLGRVVPQPLTQSGLTGMLTKPLTIDGFIQVSGLHANSLRKCGKDQVFVCTKIDRIQVSPVFESGDIESPEFDVYSNLTEIGDKVVSNDIYVFDSSRRLVVIVFGAVFTRVAISSLTRVLAQANKSSVDSTKPTAKPIKRTSKPVDETSWAIEPTKLPKKTESEVKIQIRSVPSGQDSDISKMEADLQNLLHKVTDIPVADLDPEVSVDSLGVDSLMSTEIASEVSELYKIDFDAHELLNLPTIRQLAAALISRGCGSNFGDSNAETESDNETIYDSSTGGSATPRSMIAETPVIDDKAAINHMDEATLVHRLKKTLSTVMDLDEPIMSQTNLAELGLDSLLFMELVSDIKAEFEVDIDPHLFDNDSRFADLSHQVLKQYKLLAPTQPISTGAKKLAGNGPTMETRVYKNVDGLDLQADIYLPRKSPSAPMPVVLLIHGGGHCLYTRKDVSTKQIRMLISRGFLPVSVDYRLCPETTLLDGPMTDVRDALHWIRTKLPALAYSSFGLPVNGSRVAVVGWSTGGTLALSLGFTPAQYNQPPPSAILAFYCPSNYDHPCFKAPIYPRDAIDPPDASYDLLDSVRDAPFTAYYPPLNKGHPGSFVMGLEDPRWRIILHMNWKSQMVPILVNGLPTKAEAQVGPADVDYAALPWPSREQVTSISPFAQIASGNYHVPTFIMHGDDDDLVPCAQSQETISLLRANGVKAGIAVAKGAGHLFDIFPGADPTGTGKRAVEEGYDFLDGVFGL